MSKRGRSNSNTLTGGTNDVNPQWMIGRFNTAQLTDNQSLTGLYQIGVPVNKLGIPNSKPIIVEILKVHFYIFPAHGSIIPNANGIGTQRTTSIDLALTYGSPFSTSNTANNIDFSNPLIITAYSCQSFERLSAPSVPTSADVGYMVRDDQPYEVDCTDGSGHGILCASDTIGFYFGISSAFPTNYFGTARIMYRFKAVSLEEYVTMVQSQQSRTF